MDVLKALLAALGVTFINAAGAQDIYRPDPPASHQRIDAAHTNAITFREPLRFPLRRAWTHEFQSLTSYPLIVDGRVFILDQTDIYALDARTGRSVWGPVPLAAGAAGVVTSADLVYDDGTLFVLSADISDVKGHLQALRASNGKQLWETTIADDFFSYSSPVAANGMVFIHGVGLSYDLTAVDQKTGNVIWSTVVDGGGPALSPDILFVGYVCGAATAFSPASGSKLWQTTGTCSGGDADEPSYMDGHFYAMSGLPTGGVIYDYDQFTGAILGQFSASAPPALSNGTGMILTLSGTLQNIDLSTMVSRWTFGVKRGLGFATVPLIVNDKYVFAATGDAEIYALDLSTGSQLWKDHVRFGPIGGAYSPVAAAGLVLFNAGGRLVAYRSR